MAYKITLYSKSIGQTIDMPNDSGMRLLEACHFADIYKRKNPQAVFSVVNEETGDIEYQV